MSEKQFKLVDGELIELTKKEISDIEKDRKINNFISKKEFEINKRIYFLNKTNYKSANAFDEGLSDYPEKQNRLKAREEINLIETFTSDEQFDQLTDFDIILKSI